MLLNETVSVTLSGTSTTGLAVALTPAYSLRNSNVDDYVHNTFTVNPSTSAVALDLGKIVTAKHLLAVSNGSLSLILTQNATDRTIDFNGAIMLDGDFTAIKVTNATSDAKQLTILVSGTRAPIGVGPGVYSL